MLSWQDLTAWVGKAFLGEAPPPPKIRVRGPSGYPLWGPLAFQPGGRAYRALRDAMQPPRNDWNTYHMQTERTYRFWCLTQHRLDVFKAIERMGYGGARIHEHIWGPDDPVCGCGRWTFVILTANV